MAKDTLINIYLEDTNKHLIDIYKDERICKTVRKFFKHYDDASRKNQRQFFIDFIKKYKKELETSEYFHKSAYDQCKEGLATYCTECFKELNDKQKSVVVDKMKKLMLKKLDVNDRFLREEFEDRIYSLRYDKEDKFLVSVIINYDNYEDWSSMLGSFIEEKGWLL